MKNLLRNIVILVLVIIVFVFLFGRKHPPMPSPIQTETSKTSYFCVEGKLTIDSDEDTINMALPDGRTFTLTHVESADGVKYEDAVNKIVFWARGNNAYMTENDKTIYGDCIGGKTTATGGMTTFIDIFNTFTVTYPDFALFSGGGMSFNHDWSVNATTDGARFIVITIPKTYQPNTNFSEAKFTVGASANPEAVAQCLTGTQANPESTDITKVTIDGIEYTKIVSGDAGAGNFYNTTSYRRVADDMCYATEYTIHSTNIGAYDPSQGITQFDGEKVESTLEGIVTSFKFTK